MIGHTTDKNVSSVKLETKWRCIQMFAILYLCFFLLFLVKKGRTNLLDFNLFVTNIIQILLVVQVRIRNKHPLNSFL